MRNSQSELVHGCSDRVGGPGQLPWGDAGEVGHRGRQPELGGTGKGYVLGQLRGEERARHALHDGPAEEPGSAVHRQHRGDRSPTGGLAEDRDPSGVTAEGLDVVAHPGESGDLVEQTAVGGCPLDLREPLDPHPVVERHDDDAALACEPAAVVLGEAGHPDDVAATLDPHHDRENGAATGLGLG